MGLMVVMCRLNVDYKVMRLEKLMLVHVLEKIKVECCVIVQAFSMSWIFGCKYKFFLCFLEYWLILKDVFMFVNEFEISLKLFSVN